MLPAAFAMQNGATSLACTIVQRRGQLAKHHTDSRVLTRVRLLECPQSVPVSVARV